MWKLIKKQVTLERLFLLLIVVVAIFLRFYNLKNTMMFQGDQGRDAMVVANIFKNLDPVFIGPVTSIGNMYLGPFYYYFMLPFLFLSYPSPIGPVYAVAGLSVLTVFLLFQITKKVFDRRTAILASIFFTFSASVVNLARFSWNPNPAPFFSLLMFYFTYLSWKKDSKYWLLVSVCFSILIQLHYVTLLSLSGAGIIFLIQLIEKVKKSKGKFFNLENKFIKHTALAVIIFMISLTPLLLFDYKHDFLNAKSFSKILVKEESFDLQRKKGRKGLATFTKFISVDLKEKASLVLLEPSFAINKINHPLLFVVLILSALYLAKNKAKLKDGEKVLLAYLIPGIIGISVYQHQVYEHYIAYLFPFTYIFYGLFFNKFKYIWLKFSLLVPFLCFFLISNMNRYTIKNSDLSIAKISKVSEEIYARVKKNEKYNIVLLAASKDLYGMNYRYFLSTKENEPVKMENHHQAEKLFIINEEKVEKNILNSAIYEIVVFPNKNMVETFNVTDGPEITVLTSYNE